MTNIYQFPPVAITGWQLREERRTRRSIYALDGKRAVSGVGSARRTISLTCSALGRDRAGAGYLAELWSYIDGGVDLVRLSIPPQNWHLDRCGLRGRIGNYPLTWTDGGDPLDWENDSSPLYWFMQSIREGTAGALAGYPATLEVAGLPPNIIVARPGDIVRVYDDDGADEGAARVMDLTRSDASGDAVVPISEALPSGIVAFADEETAVFEVIEYSPQAQGIGKDWAVNMSLREVFTSEIDTPTEVNPWRE